MNFHPHKQLFQVASAGDRTTDPWITRPVLYPYPRGLTFRFSYCGLFHPQFSRKDIGTGSIAWSCLDICKPKDSLDHLHLISDVHLKEYTPFPYVIMSPSPCAVVDIFAPFLISIRRGSA